MQATVQASPGNVCEIHWVRPVSIVSTIGASLRGSAGWEYE